MNIVVNVTQKLIDIGVRGSCSDCAMALAMRKSVKKHRGYTFDRCFRVAARFLAKGKLVQISLPQRARTFIDLFDDGLPVQPITFEIELP